MAISKVVYGQNTLIDLTGDTVTADKLAYGKTAHNASGNPVSGSMQMIGANGLTWNQLTSQSWGVVSPQSEIVLNKTITYSSKVTATQTIWTVAEFGSFPYGSLTDYESLSMIAKLTSASHTTYQILFSNTFYPYFSYTTTTGYVYSGMLAYHGSSASSVYNARSSTAINGSVAGYFQVTSSGIKLVCNSSYGLYGTYQFSISAKLA